jgi:hypothetical protein
MIKYIASFIGNEKTSSLKNDLNLLSMQSKTNTKTKVCGINQFKTKTELVNHVKLAVLLEVRRIKQIFEDFKIIENNNETLLHENPIYSQQRKIFENNLQSLQEKFLIIKNIDEQMLIKKTSNVFNIEKTMIDIFNNENFHFVEKEKQKEKKKC